MKKRSSTCLNEDNDDNESIHYDNDDVYYHNNDKDEKRMMICSPKRIRGGGGGEYEEQLYDDELLEMQQQEEDEEAEEEQLLPDDEDVDNKNEEDSVVHDTTTTTTTPEGIGHSLRRPTPKTMNSDCTDMNIQWIDIDVYTGQPWTKQKKNTKNNTRKTTSSTTGCRVGPVPVIRIYGVNEDGNSVVVFVHGFTPYGYFALPPEVNADKDMTSEECSKLRQFLNSNLQSMARNIGGSTQNLQDYCLGIQVLGHKDHHRSILGYQTNHTQFLKIYVAMPQLIPTLKRIMESNGGVSLPTTTGARTSFELQPFECNVPFVLRFMIDHGLNGAGWLTLPKSTYEIRSNTGGTPKQTHCQIEVDINYTDILPRPSEGEWNKIAPLRILSLDIECQGRKGHFPEADKDPVIQIANALSVYGEQSNAPILQNVFTLKGCLPIVGTKVISSDTEAEMLMKWKQFIQACDPDIITGYNVQNFDIPYLLDRAETLCKQSSSSKTNKRSRKNNNSSSHHNNNNNKKTDLTKFPFWGRIHNSRVHMRDTVFQSAAYGKRSNVETTIDGRVIFDMLPYMQRNHKLSSYTLNSVCAEFLGQQKEDVHHSIISDLQNGSDEDRHRLAMYCLKDALLPLRLMNKLSVLINYIEMARVTGVPMSFLIARGQQIKVFSMILRKCRTQKLLVPTLKKTGGPPGSAGGGGGDGGDDGPDGVGYEGATVLDPIKNYYTVPIATLDFASLYPSIMQAYNLCYSTLISPTDVSKVDQNLYRRSDNGHCFVHSHVKKGILPTILEELLAARKRAKKDMKKAPNEFERSVQNGRQLALKVSANSVYGFTGAIVGHLPCLPIASSVTSYGRVLLEKTKEYVESTYTISNGYTFDAQVIYGDTDSVMVKFGTATVKDTFPLAMEAADKCSKIFPSPILLEFEKVYFPYLLMNKKRYAGLMWTQVDKHDKMDTKGLETVRRDNCALVRDVIQISLDKILIHQDVNGAISYVKNQISDLLQNKMDISQLVITKSLNKGAAYALGLPGASKEDYKVKQAHVELAARMKKRDAGSAPQMGDRVPYVIIGSSKNAQTYEKAEDPIYVLENNLPIDCKWYLSNQLEKPLKRIFEPIIDDVDKTLLQGDHTRKIFVPTPSARKGSLMMFAVKTVTCLGCKAAITATNSSSSSSTMMNQNKENTTTTTTTTTQQQYLCKHCQPKEAEIFLDKLNVMREAELRYAELWSDAQKVHNTVHSDIICTGDGCACQFYRRKKVQADIKLAQEVLDKFGR